MTAIEYYFIGLGIWFSIGFICFCIGIYRDFVDGSDLKIKELLLSFLCMVMGPITLVIVFKEELENFGEIIILKGKK